MEVQVLHARTVPPLVARGVIGRPRLHVLLDEAFSSPLAVIVGPAGYGKTTLVATWAATQPKPVGWLSADTEINDPGVFVHHLLAALRRAVPDLETDVLRMMDAALPIDTTGIGSRLVDDLLDLHEDIVLVIDDYHTITNSAIHDLITRIISHPPPRLHLVISTRLDPPLPLARARARGLLTEIRGAQLRFTEEETRTFFEGVGWEETAADEVRTIHERMEGWPAGLRLASLAARHDGGPRIPVSLDLDTGFQQVRAFLLEEVLSQQDEETLEFLLRTSVVRRITASLADALMDEPPPAGMSQQRLESLVRAGMFITPFGTDGIWYRYHHLLRQALQDRLNDEWSPQSIASLHCAASRWFEERGEIDDAISHALLSGDEAHAADILERRAPTVLATQDRRPVERWLSQLPAGVADDRPALQLVKAICAQLRGAVNDLALALSRFDEITGPASHDEAADMQALRLVRDVLGLSIDGALRPPAEVAALARRALDDLPDERRFARGEAVTWLGTSLSMMGEHTSAMAQLEEIARAEADRHDIVSLSALSLLVYLRIVNGNMEQAESTAVRLLTLATSANHLATQTWAHVELGVVRYERGDLAASADQFAAVLAQRDAIHPYALREATLGLALVHRAEGRVGIAHQLVQELIERLEAADAQTLLPSARAFRALAALLAGDMVTVSQWLGRARESEAPGGAVVSWAGNEQLIEARILLAVERPDEALAVIDEFLAIQKAARNLPFQAKGRAVRAAALHALGDADSALDEMAAAVDLAGRSGVYQGMIDLGSPVGRLLQQLSAVHGPTGYTGTLLQGFAPSKGLDIRSDSGNRATPRDTTLSGTIAERLTDREVEVLERLGRRLTNKEIADELFISPLTVKRHSINLYGKLDVSPRRQAVLKARALGLLPTDQP